MPSRSFLDESTRLRRIVTAGVAAASLHDDVDSVPSAGKRIDARRKAMDLVFRTRPVEDAVVMHTLHSVLIPQTLKRCAAHSPQVAAVLHKLICSLVRKADSVPSQASVWLGALYVVLKASLVAGPSASSNALMYVPRIFLSPMCVRIAESVPSRETDGGCGWSWSGELDPVVSSLISGQSEAAIQLRYRMDLFGITTTSAQEGDGFLAPQSSPYPCDGGRHWSMHVGDPIEDEERDMLQWAERYAQVTASPKVHPGGDVVDASKHDANNNVASTLAMALPRHLMFRLTATASGTTSARWNAHGCALVAMHFVMSGCQDPFGLVWRHRVDTLGASTIPRLVVHGSLCAGDVHKRTPVRGLVGMLQWAVDIGNICNALRQVVHNGDSHEKHGIIGAIGHAALRALSTKLSQIALVVSHLSSHVAQHVPSVAMKDVLSHWRTFLQPIGLLLEILADVFCVRCYEPSWSPSLSLDRCSATELLTRLYGVVVKHTPVHRCGADSVTTTPSTSHNNASHDVLRALDIGSVVSYVFLRALKPFAGTLHAWLTTTVDGLEGIDVYDEFFIVPSYGETASGFRVVAERLPSFIAPTTAQRLLAAGVARWHLVASLKQSASGLQAVDALHRTPQQLSEALRRFTLQVMPPFGAPVVDVATAAGGVHRWLDYLSYCVDPIVDDFQMPTTVSLRSPEPFKNSSGCDDDSRTVSTPQGAEMYGDAVTTEQKREGDAPQLDFQSPPSQWSARVTPSAKRLEAHLVVDEDLKKRAAQQLVDEYAKKMEILRHQEAVVRWRTRRAGHRFARAAALRSELDDIKAMHAHIVPNKARLTPVGQLVVRLEAAMDADNHAWGGITPIADDSHIGIEPDHADPVALQLSFSADGRSSNNGEEEESEPTNVHTTIVSEQHSQEALSSSTPPDADSIALAQHVTAHVLGGGQAEVPADNLAPVPMDSDELLEAQGVGVAKYHFRFVREERVIAAYLDQEAVLDRQHKQVDTDAYREACRVAAAGDAFLVNSMWSPIHDTLRDEEMLEDAIIEPSVACLLPDEAVSQLLGSDETDGVQSVLSCRAYFCDLSERLALFFVRKSLQSLLHPTSGSAARTIQCLQRVCLMQDTLLLHDTLAAWELSAFDAAGGHGGTSSFDAKATLGTMCAGFRRVWDKALDVSPDAGYLARNGRLVLELGMTMRGDGIPPTTVATAFDLLPSLGLFCVDSGDGEERGLGGALLPPHAIRRYSDLFLSLLFWRWTQKLLTRCWGMCVGCKQGQTTRRYPQELWLFCTIARSVVTAVVEYVWYQLAQACLTFNERLNALVTTERNLEALDILVHEHDAFLTTAFDVTLLGPVYARARKQLRSMVSLIEGVFAFLDKGQGVGHSPSQVDAATLAVHKKVLQQRVRDFSAAASLFVSHLQDVLASVPAELDARRPLAELVARVHAVVASTRET